jgi:hypothetical protein
MGLRRRGVSTRCQGQPHGPQLEAHDARVAVAVGVAADVPAACITHEHQTREIGRASPN